MTSAEKFAICEKCEHFKQSTKQCKLCGCFMPLKTLLPGMYCPDNPPKWGAD